METTIFIHRLLAARDQFERLVNQAGFARLSAMPLAAGEYSIKDILAHIMAYEQFLADHLHFLASGQPRVPSQGIQELDAFLAHYGYPDFESPLLGENEANAWVYETYRNAPIEEIVSLELHAFNGIIDHLVRLPHIPRSLLALLHSYTLEHYEEHLPDIQRLLQQDK